MVLESSQKLAREVINKEKWWEILSRFIEVLRINIFVVDNKNLIILPPEEGRYGGQLLTDKSLKFDLLSDSIDIQKQFEIQGTFRESCNRFGLNLFAIPIKTDGGEPIAHMVIGPVILNRRLSGVDYDLMAKECGCDKRELLGELGGIRVVSNIMINSILDLLSEIVRDNVELSQKKEELRRVKLDSDGKDLSGSFEKEAQEIYSTVYFDGVLARLLDVALKMTGAECGSIMIQDEQQGKLSVKISHGLDVQNSQWGRVKLDDGVAGVAIRENVSFIICGTQGDNRIKKFLKRPDIKEALVMPLLNKGKVFGVLNLHTKMEEGRIRKNVDNLQYLSEFLSSAI